ncbi:MAG TPA: hypothetical protein VHN80_28290, partial [Kineosporiaceae bacterium]|nr:hypothetical protein [Kineosporiaceae bacterium]
PAGNRDAAATRWVRWSRCVRATRRWPSAARRRPRAGALREDFRHEDVVVLLMANAGLLERTATTAPTAWQRHLGYLLDGLRRPARSANVPSPGEAAVVAAMADLGTRFGCS